PGAATIKPSRKPVTSGDTFSRTSHDRNYSCGVSTSDHVRHRLGSRISAAFPGSQRQEGVDIAATGIKG
ncbi:hypothetical protein ACIQFZ_38955, partial [Streptomyces sp. NPDC093064]|uniref:hypothetical protein n=1 Tax=Streptomyces sp. NPDC093064 TaxID=3366020 RepID=UPI0037F17288